MLMNWHNEMNSLAVSELKINLDFPAMDVLLWQVFGSLISFQIE